MTSAMNKGIVVKDNMFKDMLRVFTTPVTAQPCFLGTWRGHSSQYAEGMESLTFRWATSVNG